MRKILFPIIVLFLLMLESSNIFGQFAISAELRPRGEIDHGAVRPLADTLTARYYISQRTRLNFDFSKSIFDMRVTIQDIRIWGSGDIYTSTGVFGNSIGLGLYEAWVNIQPGKNTQIKIGRQELSYDNERLIARRNWNQFGLSYDAVLLIQKIKSWRFDLALTYNTMMDLNTGRPVFDDDLFDNQNLMKTFNFLRVTKSFSTNADLSAYFITSGYTNDDRPSVIYIMFSYGVYAGLNFKHFESTFDFYYQNGQAQSGKDVLAFAIGLTPTAKLGNWKIGLGGEYYSGDDARSQDYGKKVKTFNRLYGAVFKFNGLMNYYGYLKSGTKNGGLIDIYPNISWKISAKHTLKGAVHFFRLANAVLIENVVIDDLNMGTEIDTRYSFKLNNEFSVNVGFSYYVTTTTFKQVLAGLNSNIQQPYWIWTMLTYKPNIFSNRKEK